MLAAGEMDRPTENGGDQRWVGLRTVEQTHMAMLDAVPTTSLFILISLSHLYNLFLIKI